MKVGVGSHNETKTTAVARAFGASKFFADAVIVACEVKVEEFGHPVGLPAVMAGAKERARQALVGCDLGVGLEGGLMEAPGTTTGFVEVCACVIFDGQDFAWGFSPGHEWPSEVTRLIVSGKLDGSQALKRVGLTKHDKIGTTGGGIAILTHGRMDRTEYNRQAVVMALIQLENPEHYHELMPEEAGKGQK
ncbi:MAG: DUF84 family protein [bacterium]